MPLNLGLAALIPEMEFGSRGAHPGRGVWDSRRSSLPENPPVRQSVQTMLLSNPLLTRRLKEHKFMPRQGRI
jgi:hypothetical protein